MRYMLIHHLDPSVEANWNPTPEFYAQMGAFVEEANKAGILLAADGLPRPTEQSARISVKNGQQTVVDGPFAEAKEVIGGYAIVQVRDKAEAIEWSSRFGAMFDDVELEIREMATWDGDGN